MASLGGKPPLIQRYRIWPLLSHNPARGQIEGLGMRRRELLLLLGGMMPAAQPLHAQQKAMPVIGFLGGTSPGPFAPYVAAFHRGLSETGYIEGQNMAIEYRWAEDRYDRLPAMAADLVGRKVDVIATSGSPSS
jgi:putative ABC transport system substrate-binding protein